MSQICLENIVTVRDYCEGQVLQSSSGFDLMDAPEINLATLNDLATAEYQTGLSVLKNCIRLALRDIEMDFISVLHANKISINQPISEITTGTFSSSFENNGSTAKGIVIHKVNYSGIKKIKVKKLRIYPKNDHETAIIKFVDSGKEAVMAVRLVGGSINEFTTDYTVEGMDVKILLEGVETYSSTLTCLLGCGGTKPNECGYVKGWNGFSEIQSEGFGINATFSCECDYSQILCQQSKSFVGKLVWIKARIYALEERINSPRLSPFIIYGQEEAKTLRADLVNEYNQLWNVFVDTIPNIAHDAECFTCSSGRIVTNV